MGGQYNNRGGYKGGGQTKDFKADPIKQFLISRGTARDRAVELCIAGKIELSEIPLLTDKLMVLHFGHIKVDPAVDNEVMRITVRLQNRLKEIEDAKTPMDKFAEEHPVEDDDIPQGRPSDQETAFDVERERELYEREEAERSVCGEPRHEPTKETQEAVDELETADYLCKACNKQYKTKKGYDAHIAAKHLVEDSGNYGDHR